MAHLPANERLRQFLRSNVRNSRGQGQASDSLWFLAGVRQFLQFTLVLNQEFSSIES